MDWGKNLVYDVMSQSARVPSQVKLTLFYFQKLIRQKATASHWRTITLDGQGEAFGHVDLAF